MDLLRVILARLRGLLGKTGSDARLDDEIALHLELETQQRIAAGLPAAEARRQARLAFGAMEAIKEEHRDGRGIRWIEQRAQDIRYAVRGLRNRPGFTIAVVLTLALGIGANAAMFSIVDRLLFRAPPMMHHPERAHRVVFYSRNGAVEDHRTYLPYARFVDLTRETHSFSHTALFTESAIAVGPATDPRELQVAIVTSGFFGFFDARPVIGRYFTAAEDAPPRGSPVVVLSYGFWESRFGAGQKVIGEHLQIGATIYTVIGVAPRGFAGMWPDAPPVAYIPASAWAGEQQVGQPHWSTTYSWIWAESMVERKPGVSIAQANADLSQAYLHSYQNQLASTGGGASISEAKPYAAVASILSNRGPGESDLAKVATWLGGVALIVWLIACANVANLLLARALQRRREIAVRLALGIAHSRLAAQLLTESTILALLGGLSRIILAQWGGAVLRSEFLSKTSPAQVVTDPRTLIYAGAAALVAAVFCGLAPLAQTRRMNLNRDLKSGAREGGFQRSALRAGLLIFQGTLSVVLLVGAGLFVRSLRHVKAVPLGFEPAHVLLVELNMRGTAVDSARSQALRTELAGATGAIPGVVTTARQLTTPLRDESNNVITVPGVDSVSNLGAFDLTAVSPDYFATMGTRILAGRGISTADVAGAPGVLVVSQAMAKALWPHASALGQCVKIGGDEAPCRQVVGIAENIKSNGIGAEPGLYYYLSADQYQPQDGGLFVRVRGDPDRMKEPIRRALQRLMPGAAYVTVTPLRDIIGEQTETWELGASMFVIFGALALLLAAIGLYSVIAFNVGQRLHELGIRMALGASGADIVGHVVTGGLRLAVGGVILGIGVALALSHWIQPLLFNESAHDPVIFVVVAAVLLAVATLASLLPARRAARVDPMESLRGE